MKFSKLNYIILFSFFFFYKYNDSVLKMYNQFDQG